MEGLGETNSIGDGEGTGESKEDSLLADVTASYEELEGGTKTKDSQENEVTSRQNKEVPPTKKEIERPHSWAKEHWADFDAMPDNLRQVVLQRERERETYLSKKQQEIHNQILPFSQLAKDYQDIFPDGNVSIDAIKGLLQFRREFTNNPAKILGDLQEYVNSLEAGDVPNPKITELESKLNKLQWSIQEKAQQEVFAKNLDEVTRFASSKDERGELLYPYYKDIAGDMVPLLQMLKAANPHMSGQELLKDAYERATWSSSATRQKMVEAQLKTEREKIEQEKRTRSARSASLSSRGGVSNSKSAVDPNDLVALMTAIYDGEI